MDTKTKSSFKRIGHVNQTRIGEYVNEYLTQLFTRNVHTHIQVLRFQHDTPSNVFPSSLNRLPKSVFSFCDMQLTISSVDTNDGVVMST